MKTTIQQQDGNLVAVLEGRLDTAAAAATEKELQPLYDCEGKNIVFDCSKLEFISSSGLRLFLGVLKAAICFCLGGGDRHRDKLCVYKHLA